MEKHEKTDEPTEEYRDSLGQANPAHEMQLKNIGESRERQEKLDKEAVAAPKAATPAENYEEKTVVELKELAHQRGIHINSDMRKDEIIATLEEA
jgi:hypothetical protein